MADTLALILKEPRASSTTVPDAFTRVITRLMDKSDAVNDEAKQGRHLDDAQRRPRP